MANNRAIAALGAFVVFIAGFLAWTNITGPNSIFQLYYWLLVSATSELGLFAFSGGTAITSFIQLAWLLGFIFYGLGLLCGIYFVWKRTPSLYQGIFSIASGILWIYASQATLTKVFIGPLAAILGGLLLELGYALNSGRRQKTMNLIYFVIIPIVITIVLLKFPSITYNSSVVFETKNWSTDIGITNYYYITPGGSYCGFLYPCPKTNYSVSGFYYVNATAHNSTCWITKILLLNGNSKIDVTLNATQAHNVTSYMDNYEVSPYETGCGPPGVLIPSFKVKT